MSSRGSRNEVVLSVRSVNENGGEQELRSVYRNRDDALREAQLRLGTGDGETLRLTESDGAGLEHDEIVAACVRSPFPEITLLTEVHRLVVDDESFRARGLESLWLSPRADMIYLQVVTSTGPMVRGELHLPAWPTSFDGRAAELAALVSSGLPDVKPQESVADRQHLFLRVLEDITSRTQSADEYELLGIAPLLRLLLWDSPSLLDQVNRAFKVKVRFRIGPSLNPVDTGPAVSADGRLRRVQSGFLFNAIDDSFHPAGMEPEAVVTRDQLDRTPVLQVREHVLTAGQLMRHMAYRVGLVHAFDADEPSDAALLELRRGLQLGGIGPGLRALRTVAKVVTDGVEPLRQVVLEDRRRRSAGDRVREGASGPVSEPGGDRFLVTTGSGARVRNKTPLPVGRHLIECVAMGTEVGDQLRLLANGTGTGAFTVAQLEVGPDGGLRILETDGHSESYLSDLLRLDIPVGVWLRLSLCCDNGDVRASVRALDSAGRNVVSGETRSRGEEWGLGSGRVGGAVRFREVACYRFVGSSCGCCGEVHSTDAE